MTALDLSRYILTKCKRDNHLIDAMQLQGILYCAQCAFMKNYGEPLFNDDFEAFKFGPAISVVYYEYSHFGAFKIGADYKDYDKVLKDMSQDQIATLNSIIVSKRDIAALDLMREVSKAWEMVFDNGEGIGDTIKKEDMCEIGF